MPLKPIYEKAPLVALRQLPLRPGQVRCREEQLKQLYALTTMAKEKPLLWEGAFRLACVLTVKPMEEPCAHWIMTALEQQTEEGGLPFEITDAVAVTRAALAVYEWDARRPLLERLIRFCGWLKEHWESVMACAAVRIHSADLMDMLLTLYRVTGKKAILSLCERLRQGAMDWSGILHTFAVQRPMNRVTPWSDMEGGLEAEANSEAGFYTRQYLTCHGESLADGIRAALYNGRYSGNGQELSAPKVGWEKISRYHGAVCGGISADETIAGTSPSNGIDAAALGAWAEALCTAGTLDDAAWAFEAVEAMTVNGLPAAFQNDLLIPFQRVNSLSVNCGTKDCYHVHEENAQALRSLNRLCRGWACAASHAVTLSPDGASVNLYLPGRYAVPMGDGACVLHLAGVNGRYTLTMTGKKPVKAAIRLRIPAWTKEASITVNGKERHEGKPSTYLELARTWQDGDRVDMDYPEALTVSEGHHQSACIRWGAKVMAYPVQEGSWAMALCGEPCLKDGQVIAPLRRVSAWRRKGGVPADLPVLPETEGETIEACLAPYAETPCRIALFPKGRQA